MGGVTTTRTAAGAGPHAALVDQYLARLGLPGRPAPTVAALTALHRRHLDTVPYENLAAMLGRPDPAGPAVTLARVAAGGNAGYCFHHNGLLEVVLRDLGFAVERRFGHVRTLPDPELNHLGLLVTIGGRRWWPDLGLGDALRDPVEVTAGAFTQGPFRYQLTGVGEAGEWTFHHDPAAGSFGVMDMRAASPTDDQVAAAHRELSTGGGRFARVLVVQRRDDGGAETLRGLRHSRAGDGAFSRDLAAYADWRPVLTALGVSVAGVGEDELRALHARMLALHQERAAAGEA
jgi:arylamine N-acetyltransferase